MIYSNHVHTANGDKDYIYMFDSHFMFRLQYANVKSFNTNNINQTRCRRVHLHKSIYKIDYSSIIIYIHMHPLINNADRATTESMGQAWDFGQLGCGPHLD
jgi:hypothetical protein